MSRNAKSMVVYFGGFSPYELWNESLLSEDLNLWCVNEEIWVGRDAAALYAW